MFYLKLHLQRVKYEIHEKEITHKGIVSHTIKCAFIDQLVLNVEQMTINNKDKRNMEEFCEYSSLKEIESLLVDTGVLSVCELWFCV